MHADHVTVDPKTPSEAADQLGISTSTLRKWAKSGKIVSSTLVTNDMTSPVSRCPIDSITFHSPPRKRKIPSLPREESTAGSLPGSRKRTSSAKSTPYRTSSQTIPCSVTSVADSSTSAMGSRGFWNRSKCFLGSLYKSPHVLFQCRIPWFFRYCSVFTRHESYDYWFIC